VVRGLRWTHRHGLWAGRVSSNHRSGGCRGIALARVIDMYARTGHEEDVIVHTSQTRRTQASFITALTPFGYEFRTLTMSSEGEYQIADAEWNICDVPHLNHVHDWANNVQGVTDDDVESVLVVQKILGLRLPLVHSHYASGSDRHTLFFTLLTYVVVCEITFEQVTPTRTRVTTEYAVGSSRFWLLFFPLIRWLLKRNFAELMSEDIPMRERRGELRSWGYGFRGDGSPRNIRTSLDVSQDNVVLPETADRPEGDAAHVARAALRGGEWAYVGRSDHLGLKLRQVGSEILVFPRMCPHEGSSLDEVEVEGCALRCRWHGRAVRPVGRIDAEVDATEFETPHHRVEVDASTVRIRPRQDASTPAVSPP
jgi:hypothetical protein